MEKTRNETVIKTFFPANWFYEPSMNSYVYVPAGYYEVGAPLNVKETPNCIIIPRPAYGDLLDFIRKTEKGVLSTDREEDLKIIHSLLDLAKKQIGEKQCQPENKP